MGVSSSKSTECTLETSKGSLRGIELTSKDGEPVYQRFTKIPYAQPPIGPLRWRRPRPLPASASFNAPTGEPGNYASFGAVCPQPIYDHKNARLDNPTAAPLPPQIQDENCLFVNIFVPAGPPPSQGWPVVFFLHGGWLQVGDAMQDHLYDPEDLFSSTMHPRIIISPTYRLNMFGFLAGQALVDAAEDPAPGNYGFWDQRLALEWTATNIAHFGGDPANITVGGLSAGANSAFFQLYYDTYLPLEKRLIKRVFLWSNAVGIQPNSVSSDMASRQFDELCSVLGIDGSLEPKEKLAQLRAVSSAELVASIKKLKLHTFRATTDTAFIPPSFLQSLHDGSFTTRLAKNRVSVLVGEVAHERNLYRLVNPPSSFDGLRLQLQNYYPVPVVEALLDHYDLPDQNAAGEEERWKDAYARIVADCQVHAVIRGLVSTLLDPPKREGVTPLPQESVYRYRVAWRAPSLDSWIDTSVGVCHGADAPVWWCSGFRAGYTAEEKQRVKQFLEPFGRFVAGEEVQWGAKGRGQIREMGSDGVTSVVQDEDWERGMGVWRCLREAQGV